MRVEHRTVAGGIQADVLAAQHLAQITERGKGGDGGGGGGGDGPLTSRRCNLKCATCFYDYYYYEYYLSQEVVLGVLVQRGHGSRGAEPRVDGDVLLVFVVAKATVVGDADVVFQLGDLPTQSRGRLLDDAPLRISA